MTSLIAKRSRCAGHLEIESDLLVEGRTEGTIAAGGCVTIGSAGVAVSDIQCSRAVVMGIVIGNITASDRIDIVAGARVVGDVQAPTIWVAARESVEGRVIDGAADGTDFGVADPPMPPRRAATQGRSARAETAPPRVRRETAQPAPPFWTATGERALQPESARTGPPELPRLPPRTRLVPRTGGQ